MRQMPRVRSRRAQRVKIRGQIGYQYKIIEASSIHSIGSIVKTYSYNIAISIIKLTALESH